MKLNPFGKGMQISLSDLQEEMNRMFDRMWHAGISTAPFDGQDWAPVIDLVNEPTRLVLTAEVPGLRVDDIEVCYEEGQVILKGNKLSSRVEDTKVDYVRRERRFGRFQRAIPLTEAINSEAITAKCVSGVLEVVLPKKEPKLRKSVRIEVSE